MDNLSLGVTKAISELLESNETRTQKQQRRLSELERKVELLEKTCTNLMNENNKLREDLTVCSKQEEESKSSLKRTAEELNKLQGWTSVITTIAHQLNEMKDKNTEQDNKMKRLYDLIKQHQNDLNHMRQPPAPTYVHRVNNMPRSLSSRFSNIEHSSPLQESLDDEAISVLSDQTEHLKRGVDALNELQRSFEKNSLYYDDLN